MAKNETHYNAYRVVVDRKNRLKVVKKRLWFTQIIVRYPLWDSFTVYSRADGNVDVTVTY